jgi:carbohydrate kinase (thermoresistant glucokinase family)
MATGKADPDIAGAETAAAKAVAPAVLVVMGVSGSGKSTIALELQRVLGWRFQEGDDLHPPANVEKMRSGRPLDDADRLPWLQKVAGWIDARLAAREPGIITCSNLKRAYRRITIGNRTGVRLIFLKGDEGVIRQRIGGRQHRYMPPALLRSQFETLEEPGEDEHPVTVAVQGSLAQSVVEVLRRLAAPAAPAAGPPQPVLAPADRDDTVSPFTEEKPP